ncbi:MAG: hypothetical protein H6657_23470 [Ardenticatenaceae bacterium]|nr:hypothetical protein [Ardenticatenaceae bacterium]
MKKTTTPNDLSSDKGRKHTAVNIFLSRAYDLILSWPDPEKLEEEPDGNTKKRTASGCHRDGSE